MSPKKTPVHFLDLLKVIHVAVIKDKENIDPCTLAVIELPCISLNRAGHFT